jgi:sugar O-acyltransferase (sialic acid O-acetyltransferase NeuD family)
VAELVLIAASGLAREVLAAVRSAGTDTVRGFLDDDPALAGTEIDGIPVLGRIADVVDHTNAGLLVCAGKGASRERIVVRLAALGVGAGCYATFIDRTAFVSAGSQVGAGSILLAHVVLTAAVRLGSHVVAMPNVTLTHDDDVADFATFTAGVSLGGGVRIGKGAYLGMNSSVREHCSIGAGATVGMGSAVITDVPDGETWVGTPAHPLRGSGFRTLANSAERMV